MVLQTTLQCNFKKKQKKTGLIWVWESQKEKERCAGLNWETYVHTYPCWSDRLSQASLMNPLSIWGILVCGWDRISPLGWVNSPPVVVNFVHGRPTVYTGVYVFVMYIPCTGLAKMNVFHEYILTLLQPGTKQRNQIRTLFKATQWLCCVVLSDFKNVKF